MNPTWAAAAIMMSSTANILGSLLVAASLVWQAAVQPLFLCGCAASGRECPCRSGDRLANAACLCSRCAILSAQASRLDHGGEGSTPAPCRCMILPRDQLTTGLIRPGAGKQVLEIAIEVASPASDELFRRGATPARFDSCDVPRPRLQCLYCVWRN